MRSRTRRRLKPLTLATLVVFLSCFGTRSARAQSAAVRPDPAMTEPVAESGAPGGKSGRDKLVAAGTLAGIYGALTVLAYFAWYYDEPELPEFTVNGDGWFGQDTYAGGSDKIGHLWGALTVSRMTTDILEAGGWKRLPASLIASGLMLSFLTFVEVKDGYYYQFSTGDMVGNAVGAGMSVLMANVPEVDEVIDLRLEYIPSDDYLDSLLSSGDVNFLEDYSGQTYMLALHLKGIPGLADNRWTRWSRYVDLVGGYQSRNYKPDPADPDAVRSQNLFFGASLNMQHLLGEVLDIGASSSRAKRWTYGVGHRTFEHFSLPFTTLRMARVGRSPDAR